MKIGKIDISFMYEKWPSWALGFWVYYKWFGIQILMFKLVVDEHIDWNSIPEPIELPDKKELT